MIKPSSTIGRFQMNTRFVTNLRVLRVDYRSVGTKQKLDQITKHATQAEDLLQQVWLAINQHFKSDDHAHYLFAPRDLNRIVDYL